MEGLLSEQGSWCMSIETCRCSWGGRWDQRIEELRLQHSGFVARSVDIALIVNRQMTSSQASGGGRERVYWRRIRALQGVAADTCWEQSERVGNAHCRCRYTVNKADFVLIDLSIIIKDLSPRRNTQTRFGLICIFPKHSAYHFLHTAQLYKYTTIVCA